MSSGVQPTSEAIEKFQELKTAKKLTYVVYEIVDKKSIVVSKASDSKDFDEFLAELPEKTPRFAVYDYEYSLSESEGTRNKLVFVYWCPDEANVREKMLYSSSKQAIHSRLDGIHINVQATDSSEVTKDVFFDKATRP